MNADVKITILKKTVNEELYRLYAERVWESCERFGEGQEFISRQANMPEVSVVGHDD